MIYKSFKGKKLPLLGFGAMRLPTVGTEKGAAVDIGKTEQMVELAMKAGVNYFDTAYPYHGGQSEVIIGEILSKYPRESYYLADKYPGHQIRESYDPEEVFLDQLKKCGVDYFDFYLLHNVNEKSIETYTDPRWGIVEYFKEQKRLGRIKHLGFSTHAAPDCLAAFLEKYGADMEFCQIQLNYLDWTLQDAKKKYELLSEYGIPVWVMEPVRGGRLAKLPAYEEEKLTAVRAGVSIASFAFRWLMGLDNVHMILSGMSNMEQLSDNLATFEEGCPTTEEENELLSAIAGRLMNSVPCTACGYCVSGCPSGLDIPTFISVYNEMKYAKTVNAAMRVEFLPPEKQPAACIGCGACRVICPQNIDIPTILCELSDMMKTAPRWAAICRERAEEERRMKEAKNDTPSGVR